MGRKNKMRVTSDHWELILNFAEIHPEIITNKFVAHIQGKEANEKLWKQLTSNLNGLGRGLRSTAGWKKTIIDWKSKTKIKASKLHNHGSQIEAGVSTATALTSLEERLLQFMEKTGSLKDRTTTRKGLKVPLKEESITLEYEEEIDDASMETPPTIFAEPGIYNIDPTLATSGPSAEKQPNTFKHSDQVDNVEMVQILNVLETLNSNVSRMADALERIATKAEDFLNV